MWHSNRWTNIAFATCGDQERRHCCTYPWPQELSAARGSLHSADTADASHGFCCTIPPLTEELSQPQFPPLVFPDDHNNVLSPAPREDENRAVVRAGSVAVKKRDPSKP
ncbi:hypothetical protein GQ600_18624 [Phytophthora cactorum]|nr:hypothetical protein GQ600_18624 [Phytophthora cactorum]